jgi:3',5'-cyclic AMP phosphodiesterase CpdA
MFAISFSDKNNVMNRRTLLKQAGLGFLLGAVPGVRSFAAPVNKDKKRVLRFAHLTDVHVEPERNAPAGLAACLHHVQSQEDPASFILNSGDCIFDALQQPRERVEAQWKLWNDIFKSDNSLPVEYCIGNHDCWGFGEKSDPLYGVKYALEKMDLAKPYRSFDKAGWHFVILNSIKPKPDGSWYTCELDEEQFAWLQQDLAHTPGSTPVIITSHAPIVSAATVVVDNKNKGNGYELGLASMHTDSARIIPVFDRHPNIKLCLSGHIHLCEQVLYNGVTYICNGAVCGNWWAKEPRYQTKNGYAMINLYDDGSFDNEYIPYGWK